MDKLKLGAQFYTLRDFTKTPADFNRTMKRIADIGYKYVQVSGVGPDVKADVIKKACDETGLSVYITHTPLDRIMNDTEKVIEEHDMFGCNVIGLGSAGDYSKSYEGFVRLAQDIAPAVEKIKKAGKHDIILFSKWTLSHDLVGDTCTGDKSFAEYIKNYFGKENN